MMDGLSMASRVRMITMLMKLLTFAVLVTASYSLPTKDAASDVIVCESEACKSAADLILSHIDESVDPCTDWYLYACGNYAKVHPRPAQTSQIQALSLLEAANGNRSDAALDDDTFLTHGSKIVRKVKQLYDECKKKSANDGIMSLVDARNRRFLLELREKLIEYMAKTKIRTFTSMKILSVDEIMSLQMDQKTHCRTAVESKYPYAVIRTFLDKFMDKNATANIRDIINNIHDAYLNKVEVSWAKEEEKAKYREQMKKLQRNLVYPDWIVDDAELDSEYADEMVESFDDLIVSEKHKPWTMGILMVNAHFSAANEITIPAGILQDLVFNKDSAPALNYGGGGLIAGHEMSHAMSYYLAGSATSKSENCISKQLTSVVEPQTRMRYITGKWLIEEMQADVGGINASIIAMRDNVKDDIRLPGAAQNFTQTQLFFLGAANTWCHNTADSFIKSTMLLPFGHPFNYHRTVIPVMNSPDFAEAFSCKPGSPMNPVDKCRRW